MCGLKSSGLLQRAMTGASDQCLDTACKPERQVRASGTGLLRYGVQREDLSFNRPDALHSPRALPCVGQKPERGRRLSATEA